METASSSAMKRLASLLIAVISVVGIVVVAPSAGAIVDTATIVPTPDPAGPTLDQRIWSVSCTAVDACVAVGGYSNGSADQALALVWNGAAWSQVATPDPVGPADTKRLEGVSCVSSSWCVAVGWYVIGVYTQEFVLLWDGTSWTQMDTSNIGGTLDDDFKSISCVSTISCMAVGETNLGAAVGTLTAVWDGNAWTEVLSPDPGGPTTATQLWSVSCTSAQWCAAVGIYLIPGTNTYGMIWNGSTWTDTPMPVPGGTSRLHEVNSVSCVSSSWCIAVGRYNDGVADRTMVLHWDGSSWALTPSPNLGTDQRNVLNGVDCVSTTWCIAIGRYHNGTTSQTLVMQWDGSSWQFLDSPNTSTTLYNVLYKVSCPVDWWCMSTGYANNGTATTDLAIELEGPPPPSTTTTVVAPVVPAFTG